MVMQALTRVGLAVLLVLTPAFCCCKTRGLTATARTAPRPAPEQAPVESCRLKAKHSCCDTLPEQQDAPTPVTPIEHKPTKPASPDGRACCLARPDAAQTEGKPVVAAAEPTGELLAVAALLAGSPEHLVLVRRSHPSDRAGVDARSAALFARHVLRC
jgi:hypothetical protein